MSLRESAFDGRPRSGVLEPSWRVGGASSAELGALAAFARDPSLRIVGASHVEEYGKGCRAPTGAIVDFQGDDPEAGPNAPIHDRDATKTGCIKQSGRCGEVWRGLIAQRDLIAVSGFLRIGNGGEDVVQMKRLIGTYITMVFRAP